MKTLSLKTQCSLIAAIASFVFQTMPGHAAINVVSYWHLGESDRGAVVSAAATNATDSVGANNLAVQGSARYSNDVAPTAVGYAGSSLSVNFTNGRMRHVRSSPQPRII